VKIQRPDYKSQKGYSKKKNSQWKASYSKVQSEELCDCRITVSERGWFCFSIMCSCWSGRRSFSTSHTHCHLWGKGENPKAESALTTPYTPALPRPPPPRSPPLTHTLFLLSLLYCSHPFLESSFSATFWVNCGTLNWLRVYEICKPPERV